MIYMKYTVLINHLKCIKHQLQLCNNKLLNKWFGNISLFVNSEITINLS